MWRRKNKSEAEQGRASSRQVERSGGARPAFSYYTNNRGAEPARNRPGVRQEQPEAGKDGIRLRLPLSQLPFWLLIGLVAVCGLKVLFLSTSPRVIVLGKTPISATYLQSSDVYAAAAHKLLASSITSHSKITVNLGGTAQALEGKFPELQAVSLGVPLIANRPIVYVEVAQPSLVLQTPQGNYALNASGVVLAKLQTIPAQIPLVVDQSGAKPQPGKQFLPSSTVSFVQTVAYQFTAAHLSIGTFVLPSGSPYELDVHLTGQQYYVRCNLEADALTQSGAAIATIQQLGSDTPGAYLDVRVPNRVYYK